MCRGPQEARTKGDNHRAEQAVDRGAKGLPGGYGASPACIPRRRDVSFTCMLCPSVCYTLCMLHPSACCTPLHAAPLCMPHPSACCTPLHAAPLCMLHPSVCYTPLYAAHNSSTQHDLLRGTAKQQDDVFIVQKHSVSSLLLPHLLGQCLWSACDAHEVSYVLGNRGCAVVLQTSS